MNHQNPKYPRHLYDDITDNENSWGMCCSKEMAQKCAEDWYRNGGWKEYWGERLLLNLFIILNKISLLILSSFIAIITWPMALHYFKIWGISQSKFDIIRFSLMTFCIIYIIRYFIHLYIWTVKGNYPWHKLATQKIYSRILCGYFIVMLITKDLI